MLGDLTRIKARRAPAHYPLPMERTFPSPSLLTWSQGRELILPKEHGSWSLALEPLIFGLIAAPSVAGGWFALAVVAAFFARRPLRISVHEVRAERRVAARQVLAMCVGVSALAMLVAVRLAGIAWLAWLIPSALGGGWFIAFDLRSAGREQAAEVAGAAAFAWLPAALAALAGTSASTGISLALVMCGRAVPTVLCVRAALRGRKTGAWDIAPAMASAVFAIAVTLFLSLAGLAPWITVAAMILFAFRAAWLLVAPKPAVRAKTIGMLEAALGAVFVIAVALSWAA